MKRTMLRALSAALAVLLLCFALPLTAGAAGIDITADFTDPNFRVKVYRRIGKTAPEPIYDTDVADIAFLDLRWSDISSLAGLEHFVGLKDLDCSLNALTQLPALPSGLESLRCNDNELTSLPNLPAGLKGLDCSFNRLTTVDVTGVALEWLYCGGNLMTDESDVIGFTGEFSFPTQGTKAALDALLDQARVMQANSDYALRCRNRLRDAISQGQLITDDGSAPQRRQICQAQDALVSAMRNMVLKRQLSDFVRELGAVKGAIGYLRHIQFDRWGFDGYSDLIFLPLVLPFLPIIFLIAWIVSLFI